MLRKQNLGSALANHAFVRDNRASKNAIHSFIFYSFLTRECAHAHERVIAMMAFSLGRLVGSVVNFRACAVNEF